MKAKIEMADLIGLSAQLNPTYILSTDYATSRTGDVAEKEEILHIFCQLITQRRVPETLLKNRIHSQENQCPAEAR